jgi:transcription elongation factor Elf1
MISTTQYKDHWKKFSQCPMCGAIKITIETHMISNDCYVVCGNCGLNLPVEIEAMENETPREYHKRCIDLVRHKWNTRATEFELPEVRYELKNSD